VIQLAVPLIPRVLRVFSIIAAIIEEILKQAGLAKGSRRGQWIDYSLTSPAAARQAPPKPPPPESDDGDGDDDGGDDAASGSEEE